MNGAPTWKAAIDFKFVRDNADAVRDNAKARKVDADVAGIVAKYEALNALNFKCDEIREKRNANAKSMKGKMEKVLCFKQKTAYEVTHRDWRTCALPILQPLMKIWRVRIKFSALF
mgnify:CR=1 FL=1